MGAPAGDLFNLSNAIFAETGEAIPPCRIPLLAEVSSFLDGKQDVNVSLTPNYLSDTRLAKYNFYCGAI